MINDRRPRFGALNVTLAVAMLVFGTIPVYAQFSFSAGPSAFLRREMNKLIDFRVANGEAVSDLVIFFGDLDMAMVDYDDSVLALSTGGAQGIMALGIPVNDAIGTVAFVEVFPGLLYIGGGGFYYGEWISAAAGLAFGPGTISVGDNETIDLVPYLTARVATGAVIDDILAAFNLNANTGLLDFVLGLTAFKDGLDALPGGLRLSVERDPARDTTTWAAKAEPILGDDWRILGSLYVISRESPFAGFVDLSSYGMSVYVEPPRGASGTLKWTFGAMLDPIFGAMAFVGFSIAFDDAIYEEVGMRMATREGAGMKDGNLSVAFQMRDFSYFGYVADPPEYPDMGF